MKLKLGLMFVGGFLFSTLLAWTEIFPRRDTTTITVTALGGSTCHERGRSMGIYDGKKKIAAVGSCFIARPEGVSAGRLMIHPVDTDMDGNEAVFTFR